MTKNIIVKDVFQRQKILMQTKKKVVSHHMDKDRYNKMNGITNGPQINQKSQSLHRTIDDLYQWQKRKVNKIEAQRKKSASHKIISITTRCKSGTKYYNIPVEDRLIMKGIETKKKIRKIEEEKECSSENELQRINCTYPSKSKVTTFHNHLVHTEEASTLKSEFLDPVKQTLNMSSERAGWSNLTLLERNQAFLSKKEAKLKKKRNNRIKKEISECSFEPRL